MKIFIQFCLTITILWICISHVEADIDKGNGEEDVDEDNGWDYVDKGNSTCGQNFSTVSARFYLNQEFFTTGECFWNFTRNSLNTTAIVIFIHEIFLDSGDKVTFYRTCEEAQANGSISLFEDLDIHAQSGSVLLVTEEPSICMKLVGSGTSSYQRKFEGFYMNTNSLKNCALPLPPAIESLSTPLFATNFSSAAFVCHFDYVVTPLYYPAFVFEEFNLTSSLSSVELKGTTSDSTYKIIPPDFFPSVAQVEIILNWNVKSNDSFKLKIEYVNPACSKYQEVTDAPSYIIESPLVILDNGSLTKECRWVLHTPKNILGVTFNKLDFKSVLDIVAINNGPSELSPELLQITSFNRNSTSSQIIRTNEQYMWISFKPMSFESRFSANISVHGQGGYYKGAGDINMTTTTGNDTVFLLEVGKDEVVLLNFNTASQFSNPATLSIYDDFKPTNLLTTVHGNAWYPIVSRTSKMMILATNFNAGSFSANFKGVPQGCMHMSSLATDSFVLAGNCNSTCTWIIPPQDTLSNVLLLHIQYLSLEKDDTVEIIRLDSNKTVLGAVYSNVSHVPQLSIPANVGALVNVTRGSCESSSEVILVGHVSYQPACSANLSVTAPQTFQVASPNYPDTYPLLSTCIWNIDAAKNNLVHLAFSKLKLAANHCLTVTLVSDNKTLSYTGNTLPEDELVNGSAVIKFDSTNCGHSDVKQSLTSDEGFVLNGTVAGCGALLNSGTGKLDVGETKTKTMCVWKISIPAFANDKSVNVIVFNVTQNDDSGVLSVYDGASVREPRITNLTKEIWSRTNNLIVTFTLLSGTSKGFSLNYATQSCNESMQCKNKLCLHPDWRCNGINDCGDFTDEINCGSVPIPPELKEVGFSSTAFGLSIVAFFVLGIVLAIIGPYLYQRYVRGQYRRFGEISVIE